MDLNDHSSSLLKNGWDILKSERKYLRELASKQAELANLPIMEERRHMWLTLNDHGPGARPPVIVETITFDRDFMPEHIFRCTTSAGRAIEGQLLRNIRNHELIDDDKVMPNTFRIEWLVEIDHFGIDIEKQVVKDNQGIPTGFEFIHPLKNFEAAIHLLQSPRCSVDREQTMLWKAFMDDLLGDILPVEICSGIYGETMLTYSVIELMGMESFYLAMYDAPQELHLLMAYLRDGCLHVMRWAEEEGLLCLNNGNHESFGSSFNFTHNLPGDDFEQDSIRLCDMWGAANSQESVGISPAMFHEFCFPYYRDICEPMGFLYYGCCEPADPFWDDLQSLPHLKKISISKWANEEFMGEALRGSDIIYSRKPDPNLLGVDIHLDETAWANHIRKTLKATRDVGIEFIVRDVYTVHGNLDKPRRAVEIARKEIDEFLGY